jgi:hypothetical protein
VHGKSPIVACHIRALMSADSGEILTVTWSASYHHVAHNIIGSNLNIAKLIIGLEASRLLSKI